jgi:hypothetical protein
VTSRSNIKTSMHNQPSVRDSRELVPDVCRETRQLAVDMIRGDKPTTVLGVLLDRERDDPISVEALAGRLGQSVGAVTWTVEMLEEERLCGRVIRDGVTRVLAMAPYDESEPYGGSSSSQASAS